SHLSDLRVRLSGADDRPVQYSADQTSQPSALQLNARADAHRMSARRAGGRGSYSGWKRASVFPSGSLNQAALPVRRSVRGSTSALPTPTLLLAGSRRVTQQSSVRGTVAAESSSRRIAAKF